MILGVETTQTDIRAYLGGRMTLNELMRRNDEAVAFLHGDGRDAARETPALWDLVGELEGLISERVYLHLDDLSFRQRLRELAPDNANRVRRLLGFHRIIVPEISPEWEAMLRLHGHVEGHAGDDVVVDPDVKPHRPVLFRRNADAADHRMTGPWAVEA